MVCWKGTFSLNVFKYGAMDHSTAFDKSVIRIEYYYYSYNLIELVYCGLSVAIACWFRLHVRSYFLFIRTKFVAICLRFLFSSRYKELDTVTVKYRMFYYFSC